MLEQWEVFKSITSNPVSGCDWETEIVFFPDVWIEHLKTDVAWQDLRFMLLNQVWDNTAYWRNQIFYDFAFSRAQANRSLKPNPYLMDTVRHLFAIGIGSVPGFGVAIDDSMAPVSLLQKIYLENYGLKKYVPTMMHTVNFDMDTRGRPVYYSMQFPTTIEFSPKSRKISSTMGDLSELRHLIRVFMDELAHGKLEIEDTVFGELADKVRFEFFHNKPDRSAEIHLSSELVKYDPTLLQCLVECENSDFADFGTFVRGCIQLLRQ